MKFSKYSRILLFALLFCFLSSFTAYAQDYNFVITNDTQVSYTTGNDYTDVTIKLTREVKDKKYYFSTQGDHIFFIPDLLSEDDTVEREREFKKQSLQVKNDQGGDIRYVVEELEYGKGMNVKVPNYRDTTYSTPYKVYVTFKTHDYVKNIHNFVFIEYPMLSRETKSKIIDESAKTTALVNYNLSITVDNYIPPLAKVFPSNFETIKNPFSTTYVFKQEDRIGNPVYMEFGLQRNYKFEITLQTQRTDNIIPEKYSSNFPALSTNIYEVTLPREFSENKQTVRIEQISPTPTKLIVDAEGNVKASFEVPANKESKITVLGYIHLEQNPLEEAFQIPNFPFDEYMRNIRSNRNLSKYLSATKYWEIDDPFIQQEAEKLLQDNQTILDIIRSDYKYINEKLEYSHAKVSDPNSQRIGGKAALQGGASVCLEYSDAMISILRAQGIPARAATGFAYISTSKTDKDSHQWVQAWIPEYGWLSIDPSYESSNMAIGQNLQYLLWKTSYDITNPDVEIFSANNLNYDSSKYSIKVSAVDRESIPENLLLYSEIKTQEKTNNTKDTINLIIKTTPIGKATLIILPIVITVTLLVTLISLISILTRRIKTHKELSDQQH